MYNALSQAAKLKPEIRLAQALSEFGASLDEARTREFRVLQTRSPPSVEDVIRLTEEINRDGSRMHKGWRPYATSMATFLEKIQVLAQVGDFLVGSSQNLIASGVWATIKITLSMTISSMALFKRISEVFLKIRKSASSTKDLVRLFPSSKHLQELMCEYLITVVAFCQKIVRTLNKSTVVQWASPFAVFFDKEALKFESDLQHWSREIDRRFTILDSQRQADAAKTLAKISGTLSQWASSDAKKKHSLVLRREHLRDKLSARQSARFSAWLRQRKKGTTEWIFKEAAYQQWKASDTSSTLWVKGKLGSGKTVLLANIFADLYRSDFSKQGADNTVSATVPIIAYFFCQREYADSCKYDDIIGSIVQQIIVQLEPDAELITRLEEYLVRSASSTLRDEAIVILRHGLPKDRPIFLVLDALDECPEQEVAEVLGAIKSVSETCTVHLCCSTRTDAAVAQTITAIYPTIDHHITMSLAAMGDEMRGFVEAEFERRRHVRSLDKSLEDIIKEVLIGASEGMYLWVALQIEALFPYQNSKLLSDSDILRLLDNLPKDLPEAFDRALEGIMDTRYGKHIFQLVAASRRPLTLRELRIALNIQPGNLDWNSLTLPQDSRAIIALCAGGLLEIDEEEDTVLFIHHSVYQHLVNGTSSYGFRRSEAEIYSGSICVTYLNYDILNTSLTRTSNIVVNADQLTRAVSGTANTGVGTVAKVIASLRRQKESDISEVNIGQIIRRYLEPKVDAAELLVFSDYANENWIVHTMHFCPSLCADAYPLFQTLLHSRPAHLTVQWKDDLLSRQNWALDHKHFGILLACLLGSDNKRDQELAAAISEAVEEDAGELLLDSEPPGYLQRIFRLTLQHVAFNNKPGLENISDGLAMLGYDERIMVNPSDYFSELSTIARLKAMRRDTLSIVSRPATWGTRRRSLPSIDAITSGGFFKKLTVGKDENRENFLRRIFR